MEQERIESVYEMSQEEVCFFFSKTVETYM